MERSKAGMKERSPDGLSLPNQKYYLKKCIILKDMEKSQ